MRGVRYRAGWVVACCAAVGCGPDPAVMHRPKVVPVSGRVLLQGKPVEGATVTFRNPATKTSGYCRTDPEGRFALTTFDQGDGVPPGPQQVAIQKVDVVDRRKPDFDYSASSEAPPPPEERWVVPRRYASLEGSGLTAEVVDGQPNEFTFDLKN